MAASRELGTGRRMIGRFTTIVVAAATAIGAGPTTLGLALADSPPVALAAASTSTAGWTWKAEGLDGSDNDSGGESGGDTNVSGNPDGGDSDSESGSGDGPPAVESKGSDKSDTDSGSEKGPDVESGPKEPNPDDNAESGSAVGTDKEKAEPGDGGESGRAFENRMQTSEPGDDGAATAVDGKPKKPEAGDGSATTIDGRPTVPENDENGQATLPEYAGLIQDSTDPNSQVASGFNTRDPDAAAATAVGPAEGILAGNMGAQEARWKETALKSKALGPGLGPVHLPGTPNNPNRWDMVPEGKDYRYGAIGAGTATAGRLYEDAYKIDKKSAGELTKRAQKAQDTLVKAQEELRTHERFSARGAADPAIRQYYRSRVDSAAADVAHQQKLLEAMSAPKRGLDKLAGTASAATPGVQAADAVAELGPNGERMGGKIPDANLAAGATAVNAAEDLAPKPSLLGKGVGVLARGVGKAAPGLGLLATGFQAKEDLDAGKSKGRVAWESGGSVAGGMAGGAIGGAIGSVLLPGVGTAAGVALGNALGSFLGGKAGDLLADGFMGEGN